MHSENKFINALLTGITQILSGLLMFGAVAVASISLTALIMAVEEITVFIWKHRWINTYQNNYGNAWAVVFWHISLIFLSIAYWAALDVFIPKNKKSVDLNVIPEQIITEKQQQPK